LHISERPAEADDRAVPGHWEGDLLCGKRMTAVATLVERHSRFVMLVALPDGHSADVVADALATRISTLPEQLRRSLTWDQGKEMAAHARFTVETDVPVYFCDPRSPWQRGSNENTNGLLRQYFPKRSDLAPFSQADLDDVAAELNGRPRQTLGWLSPSQALDAALR
jgi:IS30 family transposase